MAGWKDRWCLLSTHHSAVRCSRSWATRIPFMWARCQTLRVKEQLDIGVRVLDLRASGTREARISHYFLCDVTLAQVLEQIREWLDRHPSEFVITYLRQDYGQKLDTSLIVEAFSNNTFRFGTPGDTDLSGKLLVLVENELLGVHINFHLWQEVFPNAHNTDIWRCKKVGEAKENVVRCLTEHRRHITGLPTGQFGGFRLDGNFPPRMPCCTSPNLNEWFVQNLASDEWHAATQHKLGLIMVDFVDQELKNRNSKE
eukprot:GEMP01083645.1.p1 GENE.GEMP01083645.1~~GEMP01083645.1.p1  ORF type:complete len:285 (+),score=57.91 GEMP01083645.1:88-855(+)